MRNKQALQNTNIQTIQKCSERMTDRHTDTCSQNFTQIYSARKILQFITVRNHTLGLHIVHVVSITANSKYSFNLELNCLKLFCSNAPHMWRQSSRSVSWSLVPRCSRFRAYFSLRGEWIEFIVDFFIVCLLQTLIVILCLQNVAGIDDFEVT